MLAAVENSGVQPKTWKPEPENLPLGPPKPLTVQDNLPLGSLKPPDNFLNPTPGSDMRHVWFDNLPLGSLKTSTSRDNLSAVDEGVLRLWKNLTLGSLSASR